MKRDLLLGVATLIAVAWPPGHRCSAAEPKTSESPSKQVALPPEQKISQTAGGGDPLLIQLRVLGPREETELPFLLDTGAAVTTLDRSFERILGSRVGTKRMYGVFRERKNQKAHIYPAPRLYLGNVQLSTGATVVTCDLSSSGNNSRCIAILGMDCLKHYCIETDFAARKLRFLESSDLKRERLGRSFSIDYANGLPVVSMRLLDRNVRFVVDSGFYQYADGTLPPDVLQLALQNHVAKDTGHALFLFESVAIGAETYKAVSFAKGEIEDQAGMLGFIGLGFLAHHVVTFDFPTGTLYFRSINNTELNK